MEAHQTQAPQHTELEPIHPGSGRNEGLLKRFGGAAAAVGLVLVKFGAKLNVLLFALPKLKLFTTSASMLVSIVAYKLIFGWPFAVGFVILLLLGLIGKIGPDSVAMLEYTGLYWHFVDLVWIFLFPLLYLV